MGLIFVTVGNRKSRCNQMCTVQMLLSIIALSLALVLVLAVVGLGVAFAMVTTQLKEEIQILQANDGVQMKELQLLWHNISTIADEIAALYSNVSLLEENIENITAIVEQSNETCLQCWVVLVTLNRRQIETEETIDQVSSSIETLSAQVIQLRNKTSELTFNIEEGDEQLNNSITRVEIGLRSEIISIEFGLRSLLNVTTANAISEIRSEVQASIDAIAQLRSEVDGTEQELSSIDTAVANLAELPTQVSQLSSRVGDNEHQIAQLRNYHGNAAALHAHAIPATVLVAVFSTMLWCFG